MLLIFRLKKTWNIRNSHPYKGLHHFFHQPQLPFFSHFWPFFFDNYLYIFHKTEVQTVNLRSWIDLDLNWFKVMTQKANGAVINRWFLSSLLWSLGHSEKHTNFLCASQKIRTLQQTNITPLQMISSNCVWFHIILIHSFIHDLC